MDNIILTVGMGIIEYYMKNNPEEKEVSEDKILEYYNKEEIDKLKDAILLREIIALKTLIDKKIFTGKRVFLLGHDTKNGIIATNILEKILKKYKISNNVEKRIIKKLNKRNYSDFNNVGLRNLIDEINKIVKEEVGNRVNICMCPAGGYKVEIFLMGLMAQILHIKSYFMFDEFDSISEIAPFPLRIDYNFYWEHCEFFRSFEENEYISPDKLKEYLFPASRLSQFVEELEIKNKKVVGLSALGEYYTKLSTDLSNLPINRSSYSPLDKEIILRVEMIPELETLINSLKSSPYVTKVILTYFNPDRNCTSSRFYLVNNSQNDQIISLEYACMDGGIAGIDIYTVGSTENELRSLVAYFNGSFIH